MQRSTSKLQNLNHAFAQDCAAISNLRWRECRVCLLALMPSEKKEKEPDPQISHRVLCSVLQTGISCSDNQITLVSAEGKEFGINEPLAKASSPFFAGVFDDGVWQESGEPRIRIVFPPVILRPSCMPAHQFIHGYSCGMACEQTSGILLISW